MVRTCLLSIDPVFRAIFPVLPRCYLPIAFFVLIISVFSPSESLGYSLRLPEEVFNGQPFRIAVDPEGGFERMKLELKHLSLDLPLTPDKENVFWSRAGLEQKGPLEIKIELTGPRGEESIVHRVGVKKRDYPAQHLDLPEDMVSFDEQTLKRINLEKGLINTALSVMTPSQHFSGRFVYPVQGKVLSEFGLRRFLNDKPRSPHRGVDFRAAEGKEIKACNSGEVVLTGSFFFGGKTVIIDHGAGIQSLYMHLSKISVNQGEMVDKGSLVGLAGNTGRATGPHLHFGICVWGEMVDPLYMLKKSRQ
ncbi:MAG: M23 family metallopeptidase [Desulfonatronovibrionaceae bacterium]